MKLFQNKKYSIKTPLVSPKEQFHLSRNKTTADFHWDVEKGESGCDGLNCVSQYSYAEILTRVPQNVTVFADKAFEEVTKLT